MYRCQQQRWALQHIVDAVCQSKLNIGFTHGKETNGKKFFVFLRDLIWYLYPHWKTLEDYGIKLPAFFNTVYKLRSGDAECQPHYIIINNYKAKGKAKPKMKQEKLKFFSY